MRLSKLIIFTSALVVVSCGKTSPSAKEDNGGGEISFVTRATGWDGILGISSTEEFWGLSAYASNGTILSNAKMQQTAGSLGWSDEEYKESQFVDAPPDLSAHGDITISAYYPYRGDLKEYNETNFPPSSTDIRPQLTTNTLGHLAIHYGIPTYRIARHPGAVADGYDGIFHYVGGETSDKTRDVILLGCHKTITPSAMVDGKATVKIELMPVTCRVAFVFSLAPRYDGEGHLAASQPDTEDYQIMSVHRYRSNRANDGKNYERSSFNYDLVTGKITDMKFRSAGAATQTDGQFFTFPVMDGDSGYNDAWGPVNPYEYNSPASEDKIAAVEFLCFPTTYDDLQNIKFEVKYRYRIKKSSSEPPDPSEDVWVESTAAFTAASSYLVEGWKSGRVYRYHVYISRHEVDYEVEIVPWEFDTEDDLFFGDIQV